MKPFHLSIVAPDRSVVEEPAVSVIAPGSEGYFGVLAGHVPFVAGLKTGLLEYEDANGQRRFVAVSGGFFEASEGKATVLADTAERAEEIDVRRAERSAERARAALRGEESDMTTDQAVAALERAINRLRIATKL